MVVEASNNHLSSSMEHKDRSDLNQKKSQNYFLKTQQSQPGSLQNQQLCQVAQFYQQHKNQKQQNIVNNYISPTNSDEQQQIANMNTNQSSNYYTLNSSQSDKEKSCELVDINSLTV